MSLSTRAIINMPNRKRDRHICLTREPKQSTYETLNVWKGNTTPPTGEASWGREREYCSDACRQRARKETVRKRLWIVNNEHCYWKSGVTKPGYTAIPFPLECTDGIDTNVSAAFEQYACC